jgi:hypothetical protein
MSGDPEQEYFADGMADEIITALSRFHHLFVIARNSSFMYKGRSVDVKQIPQPHGFASRRRREAVRQGLPRARHRPFVLGLPGETKETIEETIRFAIEINPHNAARRSRP